jgi:osmotically-inducible protein OsmY
VAQLRGPRPGTVLGQAEGREEPDEGEVDWEYQRRAAKRAVQNLTGVRGVASQLLVKPKATPFDVSQHIKDALRRQAELDAARIRVEVADGAVTLRGTVRSWAERRDAENAAWGAPGVARVDDQLVVML